MMEDELGSHIYIGSLSDFPPFPKPSCVTIGELNCQVQVEDTTRSNLDEEVESVFRCLTENHLQVLSSSLETANPRRIPFVKTTAKEPFMLTPRDTGFKAIWTELIDKGLQALFSLGTLQTTAVTKSIAAVVHKVQSFSQLLDTSTRYFKSIVFPHLAKTDEELINYNAPVRNWASSWLRAVDWHPNSSNLAIVLHDESVKILINQQPQSIITIPKSEQQWMVSCIKWHPLANEFVLGMGTGFMTWALRSSKDSPKKLFRCTVELGHAPVTCVDFSQLGDKMLTSSVVDPNIMIWTYGNNEGVPLCRLAGGGIPRATFSSTSPLEIFCITPAKYFRLWELYTSKVKVHKWVTSKSSPIEAFAWHPTKHTVHFVSESILFELSKNIFGEYEIHPVFYLQSTEVVQESTGLTQRVGGRILNIEWDPFGKRLAVLFSDAPCIAVLHCVQGRILQPCYFITGIGKEYPVAINFQKNLKHCSILSIFWSSQRIQHFPMVFETMVPSAKALNSECKVFSDLYVENTKDYDDDVPMCEQQELGQGDINLAKF